jgi:WD40 repeat protein
VRSEVYHQWSSPLVTHPHLSGVDVSPDGNWFAYMDREHLFLGDARTGRGFTAVALPYGSWPKFHPNGRSLFTLKGDALLQWPIDEDATGPRLGTPDLLASTRQGEWQRTAISADGEWMAIAGHFNNVLIDLREPSHRIEFARGLRESFVALDRNKRWVAVASHLGNGVTVWNTRDGKLIRHVITNDNAQLAVSADGRTLATATARECCWWNTETWELRKRIPLNLTGEPGVPLAFSANGKWFALAVDLQRIRLFDATSAAEVATLTSPQLLNVNPIVFSADGRRLLAATSSGVVCAWDLGALRRELTSMGLDW